MNHLILSLLLGVAGTCLGASYVRVCYFAGWARYRNGDAQFDADDVDVNLCTHMMFAFATLDSSATNLKATESGDDPAAYKRFTDLKKRNPKLKTLLSVGGWTMGSKGFSLLVSSQHKMNTFAHNAVTYLRSHNFDGLDVDWEYPADRGSPPEDKHHFTQLLQILHKAFVNEAAKSGKPRLLLTAAVATSPYQVGHSYELPQIARFLDFINLMTYDFHGPWDSDQGTGHHSTLFGSDKNDQLNTDFLVNFWVKKGVPKKKLVVGVPLYGRTFQVTDTSNAGVGAQTTGPGSAGKYTKEEGILAYHEICDLITNAGATVHRLTDEKVPVMIDGHRWTGFDDVQSVRAKAQYVVDHGFGGIMVWALDLDDFKGNCGEKFPLMKAITSVLGTHVVG